VNLAERWADFVVSAASVDRVGDRLNPRGIDLDDFEKHPIALLNHNPDKPIGLWQDEAGQCTIRVQGEKLIGRLYFFETEDADKALSLAAQGGLGASVGFNPLSEPRRNNYGGEDYENWVVHEISLTTLPCHPDALAMRS
jgi:phage head maturation protease